MVRNFWTEYEINYLEENYGVIPTKTIANRLNRRIECIYSKISKIRGVTSRKMSLGDEIFIKIEEILVQNKGSIPLRVLKNETGLSKGGIYNRISFLEEMGLIKTTSISLRDKNGKKKKGRPITIIKMLKKEWV
jgi:hypothetical protein